MDMQSFVVKYHDFVEEIATDCFVIKATQGMFDSDDDIVGYPFQALWDTGATNSMITTKVIEQLGLKPVSFATIYHAGGESERPVYVVFFQLPNEILVGPMQVTEGQLEGIDVLIGMDVIGNGDFVITNNDDHTTFSYTTPSVMKL